MSGRERLPNKRGHEVVTFAHGPFGYIGGVGRFPDGRLAEVFLSVSKSGTAIESWSQDSAVVASLALQYGCPADVLRAALGRDQAGRPATPLGALLDLLADAGGAA